MPFSNTPIRVVRTLDDYDYNGGMNSYRRHLIPTPGDLSRIP